MSHPKPLHPFPLTLGKSEGALLDKDGFGVIDIDSSSAILEDYDTKLGIPHWADKPGEAYRDLSEEEVAATTLHTFVAYNCHQALVDALEKCHEVLRQGGVTAPGKAEALNAATEALNEVACQMAVANGHLYETAL